MVEDATQIGQGADPGEALRVQHAAGVQDQLGGEQVVLLRQQHLHLGRHALELLTAGRQPDLTAQGQHRSLRAVVHMQRAKARVHFRQKLQALLVLEGPVPESREGIALGHEQLELPVGLEHVGAQVADLLLRRCMLAHPTATIGGIG